MLSFCLHGIYHFKLHHHLLRLRNDCTNNNRYNKYRLKIQNKSNKCYFISHSFKPQRKKKLCCIYHYKTQH